MSGENWTTFTRRTNDPKLSYIERRLDLMGVPHRRGTCSSWQAPILEVPSHREQECWDMLSSKMSVDGKLQVLDDIRDDHPMFKEGS
jgi:hypothetical protein